MNGGFWNKKRKSIFKYTKKKGRKMKNDQSCSLSRSIKLHLPQSFTLSTATFESKIFCLFFFLCNEAIICLRRMSSFFINRALSLFFFLCYSILCLIDEIEIEGRIGNIVVSRIQDYI